VTACTSPFCQVLFASCHLREPEWLRLEGTSGGHLVRLPCLNRAMPFEYLQGWRLYHLSEQPVPALASFHPPRFTPSVYPRPLCLYSLPLFHSTSLPWLQLWVGMRLVLHAHLQSSSKNSLEKNCWVLFCLLFTASAMGKIFQKCADDSPSYCPGLIQL